MQGEPRYHRPVKDAWLPAFAPRILRRTGPKEETVSDPLIAVLERIASALEALIPAPSPEPAFETANTFLYDPRTGRFIAAGDPAITLDLLAGVDRQKALVTAALERFALGHPSNHILLWGARGAGKSSLAKAAFLNALAHSPGLKLVEVDRNAIAALPALFEVLRERALRFVVFCDDLSFEEGAQAAKALKSALEGGVLGPPPNCLFMATSNRRHLMPRTHDEDRGAFASAEDGEEEVSVSDRFGLWIGFPPMDQATYLEAVHRYAARYELTAPGLDARALRWAQLRGARSGRVAWQFIRDLAGELGRDLS
jgi:predicted AAA+ superfamily ATPase